MNMTTKTLIRNAFEQLLEERPYGRITVQNIVDRCGISRNTFYYHFKDIEALCDASIQEWVERLEDDRTRMLSPLDCLSAIVAMCDSHRKVLCNICRSPHRELFFSLLEKCAMKVVARYAEQNFPVVGESENDQKSLVRFHKCVLMGLLMDWFQAGMEYDLMSFASRANVLIFKPEWSRPAEYFRQVPRRPIDTKKDKS